MANGVLDVWLLPHPGDSAQAAIFESVLDSKIIYLYCNCTLGEDV